MENKIYKYEPYCNCIENKILGVKPFINSDNNYTPYCRWCGKDFKTNKN